MTAGCISGGSCSDADVLKFTKNLECLDSSFYGSASGLSSGTAALASEFAKESAARLTALDSQLQSLGQTPSPCPSVNTGLFSYPSPIESHFVQ